MIFTKLMGGLVNQMFQYACAKAVAHNSNTKCFIDKSFLEDKNSGVTVHRDYELNLFPNIKADVYRGGNVDALMVREPYFHCDEGLRHAKLNEDQNFYLDGYWQSHKYFENIEREIRHEFSFPVIKNIKTESLKQKILFENSVMINVRRSDYLSDPQFEKITMDYYNECVAKIEEMVDNPSFYVFSDDIDWCKDNFADEKFTVVDHSHKGTRFIDYLNLMTSCKHQIIPNSTFAWWAAWLNENDNKIVMYPSKWFTESHKETKDLCPNDWRAV